MSVDNVEELFANSTADLCNDSSFSVFLLRLSQGTSDVDLNKAVSGEAVFGKVTFSPFGGVTVNKNKDLIAKFLVLLVEFLVVFLDVFMNFYEFTILNS